MVAASSGCPIVHNYGITVDSFDEPIDQHGWRTGLLLIDSGEAGGSTIITHGSVLDKFKTTGHIHRMGRVSTKPQILDAAVGLFHRQGYNGSGVQDIVAEAGVPKGSFYNHFASKEALGIAALQRYWEGGATLLEMLRDDAKRPADRLRAYFQALADITRRADHRFGCMIGNLGSELGGTTPSIRVEIAAIMASWSGAIADCIRHGQRDGSIRGDMEPEELGLFLLDAWEGALLRAKVDRSEAPIAAFMTIALGGLLQTS